MIEKEVTEIVTGFSGVWARVLRDWPRLAFDYTWPTAGTLDLLLAHLVRKPNYTAGEEQLILGASAYIGALAHESWRTLGGGTEARLFYEAEAQEIILRATGGRHLREDECFQVKLTSSLRSILQSPADPFPFFADFTRSLATSPPIISLFALGLSTGITPYGEGPWRSLPEAEAKEHLLAPEMYLASTCADHYRAAFPSEPHGADRDLYLSQLILPPLGYRESFFGGRAAFGLAHYVRQKALSDTDAFALGQNLAQLPEQQLALAGFLLAVVTAKETVPQRLRLMGDSLSALLPGFKPALALMRTQFGKPDPLKLIEEGNLDEAEKLLEQERQFGLLPLLRDRLTELLPVPKLVPRAYWCLPAEARAAIDAHAATTPLTAGQILFGIYLDIVSGDFARAQRELQDQEKNRVLARLESPLHRARRDEAIAYVAANMGNMPVAIPMMARAADSTALSPVERSRLTTLQAELVLRTGNRDDALLLIGKALKLAPNLRAELIRFELGFDPDDERSLPELERLARSAPHSAGLFQLLIQTKLKRLILEPA